MECIVSLVMDPNFGEKLARVYPATFVWICKSERNSAVVNSIRTSPEFQADCRADPLTVFDQVSPNTSLAFCEVLASIEEHQRWTTLDVYGVTLSSSINAKVKNEFPTVQIRIREFGFSLNRQFKI